MAAAASSAVMAAAASPADADEENPLDGVRLKDLGCFFIKSCEKCFKINAQMFQSQCTIMPKSM